jgi:hypothetical protein
MGAAAQAAPEPACLGEEGATIEEARVTGAAPQEILDRSGLTPETEGFIRELCAAPDPEAAGTVVERHGDALWRTAVDRVRETGYAEGDLSAGDDRPLYWARLTMTSALNRWEPGFEVDEADRAGLVADMDRRSRGHDDADFSEATGDSEVPRVVVTGFDGTPEAFELIRSRPAPSTRAAS